MSVNLWAVGSEAVFSEMDEWWIKSGWSAPQTGPPYPPEYRTKPGIRVTAIRLDPVRYVYFNMGIVKPPLYERYAGIPVVVKR